MVARMIVPRGRVILEVGRWTDVGRLKFQNSSVLYPYWPRGGSTKYRCWSKLTSQPTKLTTTITFIETLIDHRSSTFSTTISMTQTTISPTGTTSH